MNTNLETNITVRADDDMARYLGTGIIQSGAEGKYVRNMQRCLIKGGYLAEGEDDGVWGSKTSEALKDYQQDLYNEHRLLSVDKKFGPLTRAEMWKDYGDYLMKNF